MPSGAASHRSSWKLALCHSPFLGLPDSWGGPCVCMQALLGFSRLERHPGDSSPGPWPPHSMGCSHGCLTGRCRWHPHPASTRPAHLSAGNGPCLGFRKPKQPYQWLSYQEVSERTDPTPRACADALPGGLVGTLLGLRGELFLCPASLPSSWQQPHRAPCRPE